ncbi:TPA: hypothetical protein KNP30_003796 [Clostridioides difficile]|nr:hypothetical protein [Clostridioides difficile]
MDKFKREEHFEFLVLYRDGDYKVEGLKDFEEELYIKELKETKSLMRGCFVLRETRTSFFLE